MGDNIIVVGSNGVPIKEDYYGEINYQTDMEDDGRSHQRKERYYYPSRYNSSLENNRHDINDKAKGVRKKKANFRPFFTAENPPPFQSIIPRHNLNNLSNQNDSHSTTENSFSLISSTNGGHNLDEMRNPRHDQQYDRYVNSHYIPPFNKSYKSNSSFTTNQEVSMSDANHTEDIQKWYKSDNDTSYTDLINSVHRNCSSYQAQNISTPLNSKNSKNESNSTLNPETYIFSEQLQKLKEQQAVMKNTMQEQSHFNVHGTLAHNTAEQLKYSKPFDYNSIAPTAGKYLNEYDHMQNNDISKLPPIDISKLTVQEPFTSRMPLLEASPFELSRKTVQRPTMSMEETSLLELSRRAVQRPSLPLTTVQGALPTYSSRSAVQRTNTPILPIQQRTYIDQLNKSVYGSNKSIEELTYEYEINRPMQNVQSIPRKQTELTQIQQQTRGRELESPFNYAQQLPYPYKSENSVETQPSLPNPSLYQTQHQQNMQQSPQYNDPMRLRPPSPSTYQYESIPVSPFSIQPSAVPTIRRIQIPLSVMDPVYPEIENLVRSYLQLDEALAADHPGDQTLHIQVMRPVASFSFRPRFSSPSEGFIDNNNSRQSQGAPDNAHYNGGTSHYASGVDFDRFNNSGNFNSSGNSPW